MNKFILALLILVFVSTSYSLPGPQGKTASFGIQIGDPTAITTKLWTSNQNALQFALGSSFFGGLALSGDYLWHFDVFNTSQDLYLYAGPGVVLGFGRGNEFIYRQDDDDKFYRRDGIGVGGRGVVGVNWYPKRTPIELYGELGVLVGIIPKVGAGTQFSIGVRFYF